MKLVSVLMPIYNVERFIKESLLSILNQTYQNIEVIIVDDCSTDSTLKIVKQLAIKDERIKIYKNDTNERIVKTLNFAYSQSSGDYILRMDGDDISELDRLEKKMKFLSDHPEIDLVGCSVKSINEEGTELRLKKMPSNVKAINKSVKYTNPVFHIWLARREVYERLNGYRDLLYVEDYDFLLRMMSMGLKFTNIDDYYGYSVRIRKGNSNTTAGLKQRKAHEYAYSLYEMRMTEGWDNFSMERQLSYIDINEDSSRKYELSSKYLNEAIKFKNTRIFSKIYYIILSYVASKDQRRYINSALLTKIIYAIYN